MHSGKVVYIKIPAFGFSNTSELDNKPMTLAEVLIANEIKNVDKKPTLSKDTFIPKEALV